LNRHSSIHSALQPNKKLICRQQNTINKTKDANKTFTILRKILKPHRNPEIDYLKYKIILCVVKNLETPLIL
jgi:hypothetical protein